MQGEWSCAMKRAAAVCALSLCLALPAAARDPAMVDSDGKPRSERAQWVYRIVSKWGGHVQEAHRADPRQWARAMHEIFVRVPVPTLREAAQARSFPAMNDVLLTMSSPSMPPSKVAAKPADSGTKALGDPAQDLVYVPVTPCRILDTRVVGGPIPGNSFRDFDLTDVVRFAGQGGDTSNCNVGDKGSFAAAALNITVVQPATGGYITVFPYLSSQPTASTLNYVAGDVRNGLTITRLDQSAATYEFSVYSFAQTHLVADVVGYFREPEAAALDCYNTPESSYSVPGGVLLNISGPSCQLGYVAVSGGCKAASLNTSTFMMGNYTENDRHTCQVYHGSGVRAASVFTRCCRSRGK